MKSRRDLLTSFVAGNLTGISAFYMLSNYLSTDAAIIEWGNDLNQSVQMTTTVRQTDSWLSEEQVVYHNESELYPTKHYRAIDSNTVQTGTYKVEFVAEISEGSRTIGPSQTTWRPHGCDRQRLVIRIEDENTIKFYQRDCQ